MTKITKKLEKCEKILERPMDAAMPCKRLPNSITDVTAKLEIGPEKNSKTV